MRTCHEKENFYTKPIEWCCEKLRVAGFVIDNQFDEYSANRDPAPAVMATVEEKIRSYGEEIVDKCHYRLLYCPFCGEPIVSTCVGRQDVTEEYDFYCRKSMEKKLDYWDYTYEDRHDTTIANQLLRESKDYEEEAISLYKNEIVEVK